MAVFAPLGSLNQHLPLPLLPIGWHRAILRQVIVVIEVLLVLHDFDEHVQDRRFHSLADPREAKHLLEDLVSDLLWRHLGVKDVLLEKGVLAVHVRTVEESVAIHDLVHKVGPPSSSIVLVIVIFPLDIVLIAPDIALFNGQGGRQGLSRRPRSLKAQWTILTLRDFLNRRHVRRRLARRSLLLVPSILIKGLLQLPQPFVKVDVNIGPADLHQRVVSRLHEDYILLVEVLEDGVAENAIDRFPVARDQALLVEVDEVAFDDLLLIVCL